METLDTTGLPTAELDVRAVRDLEVVSETNLAPPEAKQRVIGDFTWNVAEGAAYTLYEMVITLFRASNDSGGYKAYLTFSARRSSHGHFTDADTHYLDHGLYLYTKLKNDAGGVLLQWDIPVVNVFCGENQVPVFFQKENVNPDIYPLVTQCEFGQARHNRGGRC